MNPQSQCLMRAITGPIVMITIGVLFTIQHVAGISFGQTWPVLLIVIGVLKLMGGRRPPRDKYYAPPYSASYVPPSPPPPSAPGERR